MSLPEPPGVESHSEGDASHGWHRVRRFLNFVPSEAGIKVVYVDVLVPTDVRVAGEDEGLERE